MWPHKALAVCRGVRSSSCFAVPSCSSSSMVAGPNTNRSPLFLLLGVYPKRNASVEPLGSLFSNTIILCFSRVGVPVHCCQTPPGVLLVLFFMLWPSADGLWPVATGARRGEGWRPCEPSPGSLPGLRTAWPCPAGWAWGKASNSSTDRYPPLAYKTGGGGSLHHLVS